MNNYFCGWYLKCQNSSQTVALIPAYHVSNGERSCSIQLITDNGSWTVRFPYSAFHKHKTGVEILGNRFGRDGIFLDLHTPDLSAAGSIVFGSFTPLRYDIMGPFRYIPFLECRHTVFSMGHRVNGSLEINGVSYVFDNGIGYMEGDRGNSFPKSYLWTQCSFPEGALMLSVADIPLCGFHFTGVICAILFRGKEYRMGTYLGAKAVKIHSGEVIIKQGSRQLTVRRLEEKSHDLAAPVGGCMSRIIREAPQCRVHYHYQEDGRTIFEFEQPNAAFEYEYPQ